MEKRPDIAQMFQDVHDLRSFKPHETDLYAAVALAGEVGEMLNFIKKEIRSGHKVDNQADIEKEVPDILFYLIEFCQDRNIDLPKVWDDKMRFNATKYERRLSRLDKP